MQRLSEEQLLDAVIAGEMATLALLVERYQHVLTGYLDRLVGSDWALAQDLAQEAFLRVLAKHTSHVSAFRSSLAGMSILYYVHK